MVAAECRHELIGKPARVAHVVIDAGVNLQKRGHVELLGIEILGVNLILIIWI
jgi:hypothetical protein